MGAQSFHDELVVGALGQTRDGDSANDAGPGHRERKGTAVGGVIGGGQTVFFQEAGLALLQFQAHPIGTAVEAGDDFAFAPDPIGVVGRGPGEGAIKQGLAESVNVNDHRQMDRYISRVLARWELVGSNQDYSRARGEGLQRLDLVESELWSMTQNLDDVGRKQTIMQTILNVHKHRMDLLGLTPKVIEHIGLGNESDVAFSKVASTHERMSMLAARMMHMIEERTKVIDHVPSDRET